MQNIVKLRFLRHSSLNRGFLVAGGTNALKKDLDPFYPHVAFCRKL